ncbi:hypothetical protein OG596_16820 [Streptomyces sp. NBC_01102]|uniref:hypothetical protein n=1 Tax=unclassified Streptomyces TaxID=2593676 RepID=UPI003863600C|nr:hypothetical protein OG596_16820 [Streptomyces sp. NBC_01102]
MTPPEPDTEARPERPTLLWGVSLASSGVFLVTWALLWLNAYAINDDLPNTCQNVRRQSFPPEVTCASAGGMVTGGSAGWLEALFFASLVVTVLTTTMALATAMATRRR